MEVQNESDAQRQATVSVKGSEAQNVTLKAGERKKLAFTYTIENPRLWSPSDPYLYTGYDLRHHHHALADADACAAIALCLL